MHGAVMLDASGDVVRPALIWCDVRTENQCRELTEHVGAEQLIRLTCNPALANFTVTKLLWTRENEPENWKRVRSVLLPKDYVRFRLTEEKATDVADASGTLLLNVAQRQWSAEVLQAAEIDRSLLPRSMNRRKSAGKSLPGGPKLPVCRLEHMSWRARGPSRGRHRHGHRRSGRCERHDWNLRSRFCGDGSSGDGC